MVTYYSDGGPTSLCLILASDTVSTDSTPAGPASLGKCKLLSIDSPVQVGEEFHATWVGRLDSIRFRQSGAGLHFQFPILGSAHFDDGARAARFSSTGLDRGRWLASCWGEEGTFGVEKAVLIQ